MKNYINEKSGILSWLFTNDHKRIGIMYLFTIFAAFAVGGFAALILRFELLSPDQILLTAKQYNQSFTLHGAIMVFLFIIPSIPATLGNIILPLQLGANDVAFPKLNLASFHIYILGAIFCIASIILGAVDTGWTFYTPYSTTTNTAVLSMVTGVFILGFSSILTGVNFIATIHYLRAPGMTWFRMPLFVWSLYATSIIQVLATPVLAITLVLLMLEKVWGIGIFDPAIGGDPVLFQHFFWFYSHPAVYIMILPAMGVINEIVTTFCRKNIFGYHAIAYSSIAIAIISFLVWGHHMFTSTSEVAATVFSFLTFLVAIPSGIKVFNWIATMYKGSIDFSTPFLYFIGFMVLFVIGGFTGIFLGTLAIDVHLHDTYFVVAHFHYVMFGGTLYAFLAGLHYWWPKMFGKMYSELQAKIAYWLIFIGFNLTFFIQFIMGSKGMPRRYYTYIEEFQIYHQISTVGSWLIGLGFIVMLYYLVASLRSGEKAPNNPWGGLTLEWTLPSPPAYHAFENTPTVTQGPYEYGIEKNG
ncbi:MAG: cytochrome c oxidase subunit I [Candidatus Margulisiibacteriota bacterium]